MGTLREQVGGGPLPAAAALFGRLRFFFTFIPCCGAGSPLMTTFAVLPASKPWPVPSGAPGAFAALLGLPMGVAGGRLLAAFLPFAGPPARGRFLPAQSSGDWGISG